MAQRGRPRKLVETNVSEVEHNMKVHQEDEQRKADNPVVDTWLTLSHGKFLKCQKTKNGNIYRTYLGGELTKKKDSEGNVSFMPNPSIDQAKKNGTYRHDLG